MKSRKEVTELKNKARCYSANNPPPHIYFYNFRLSCSESVVAHLYCLSKLDSISTLLDLQNAFAKNQIFESINYVSHNGGMNIIDSRVEINKELRRMIIDRLIYNDSGPVLDETRVEILDLSVGKTILI